MFRSRLLQLQRDGRTASHVDLEIEGSRGPMAQSMETICEHPGLDMALDETGEQSNHMCCPCLTQAAQVSPPYPKIMNNCHSGDTFCCVQPSSPVFKQAPEHLSGCVCTDRHCGTKDQYGLLIIYIA